MTEVINARLSNVKWFKNYTKKDLSFNTQTSHSLTTAFRNCYTNANLIAVK